jgi:formyltetrahydrofolate deformylase
MDPNGLNTAGYVLTLTCPDRIGIVHSVSGWLVSQNCNILDSAQFRDPGTGLFAMRVHFEPSAPAAPEAELRHSFEPVARKFGLVWEIRDCRVRPRLLILVSKQDHCLRDLLYRSAAGDLAVDIALVVSNHESASRLVQEHGVPFLYRPVDPATRATQEQALIDLAEAHRIDLIVLARYMQILSPRICAHFPGRIINIHHSFLPGFKGANPYRQAYDRGVKLIGATAHYVTPDLDEGPIIEQDVARVDHSKSPRELTMLGKDLERIVLARAVRFHAEHRIVLNGNKTVVFA